MIFSDYLEEHGFSEAAMAIRSRCSNDTPMNWDQSGVRTLFSLDLPDARVERIFTNHGLGGRLDLHFMGDSKSHILDLREDVKLKMVLVPKGTFWMGGGGGEPGEQ